MARSRVSDFTARFPIMGLDQSRGVEDQDPMTSAELQNVRPFDASENRARGGSRPGLGSYVAKDSGNSNPVQCLVEFYGTELDSSDPAGISNRGEGALAVIGGYIYKITFGGSKPYSMAKALDSGGGAPSSPPLSTTAKVIQAAPVSDTVYFSDGAGNRVYYDSQDNRVKTWALGTYAAADVERPLVYGDVFKTGTTEASEHGLSITQVNEVQTVTLAGSPTGGTFTLAFKGVATTALAFDAAAADVQTALRALPTIGSGNVTVARTGVAPNYIHTCEFQGGLAKLNVPQMVSDNGGLKINEVQKIDVNNASGGTFVLHIVIGGVTYNSDAIAYDARPEAVALAITEGMSVVNPGDIQCTGDPLDSGDVYVEFRGQYAATDMAQMTVTDSTTGSGHEVVLSTTTTSLAPTVTVATQTAGVSVSQADDDRSLEADGQNRGKFPNASAGSPEKESLCVVWGDRVVLAGISNDPQNFYISRYQDPTDFDWRHRQRDLNKETNEEVRRYNTQVAAEVAAFNTQLLKNITDYNTKVDAQITRANTIGASNAQGYLVGTTRYGASTWTNKVPSNYYKDYDTLKKDVQAHERDLQPTRYGDIEDDTDRAVVGRYSPLGLIPDTITSLFPYNRDLLLFFCQSSIWEMSGTPNTETFRLRPVTKVIGGAEGKSWCLGPSGDIFFVSSRGGIYNLQLQSPPRRISAARIDEFMSDVDVANSYINLTWNEEAQGFHVHITPHADTATKHLFYDLRTQGWFVDVYGSTSLDPSAVLAINDRSSAKRDVVLGCRDGALRYQTVGDSQTTDDGTDIESYAMLGPFGSPDRERAMMITGLRGTIGDGSEPVDYEVLRGDTADEASAADPVTSGTWDEFRSSVDRQRASGSALFIKIKGGSTFAPWSFERVLISTRFSGRVFGRTT